MEYQSETPCTLLVPVRLIKLTGVHCTALHWTDATNWYLAADKGDVPLLEIGFLDNKQEPEFFVQDLPNVGSMFSNDMLTYKIRHVYGGGVMDFRGFDASVVAG